MTRLLFPVASAMTAVLLLAAASACGDDSGLDHSPSPTGSGPSDPSPRVGGVEAAEQYLQNTGIDGDKGSFTDPRGCEEINDRTQGDFCVHEGFSTYAAGLVILRIADRDHPDKDVWEMRLTLTDERWQVDSVERFGDDN